MVLLEADVKGMYPSLSMILLSMERQVVGSEQFGDEVPRASPVAVGCISREARELSKEVTTSPAYPS